MNIETQGIYPGPNAVPGRVIAVSVSEGYIKAHFERDGRYRDYVLQMDWSYVEPTSRHICSATEGNQGYHLYGV